MPFSKTSCLVALLACVASPLLFAQTPKPIPDGDYTFHHRFAEHPSMPSVDMQVHIRDGRVVVVNTAASTAFPIGVVDEGLLLWNVKAGQWIIGRTPADKDASEVGHCTGGPEIIDLDARIYWTC